VKRIRVSLLRGVYLGPFEAQSFEPLMDRFDIRAYVLPQNRFDLTGCRLPVTVCPFPDARWFGGRSLINAWRSRVRGERYPMPGLGRIIAHSDIVHTFEAWNAYTRQAATICARHGVPLVVTHWDTQPYAGRVDSSLRAKIMKAHAQAACILAPTNAAREALLTDGVSPEKIQLQGMGVDASRFSPGERDPELARQIPLRLGDFVFLFIGRLVEDKGVFELTRAFCRLRELIGTLDQKLLLVGDGPERPRVLSAARSAGLEDRVSLVPAVPYREIHRWHRLASVFVFPSIPLESVAEQFGYALIEAMSTGTPVITSSSGGIPDVVGKAALVVPPGDVEKLSQAMARLRTDKAERDRLGSLGRKKVLDSFSTEVVSKNLARLYRKLCRS
jgi:glycosyltransferase involved in cell wall biosynthesis